ncbi:DddA-like double-stranded DNA deaminase toxin [Amycolatopsis suaedae]|uniref:Uncharacterized protein n=1 Tax=Amycolatopsis suaedae TaxID=2510978 RepID=A0A4Q7J7B6_9PSEU|nr:DddA-like double-stranded DNA deaminase toxin [Amycolatopsis suaedae]RZQ62682.1 hypothetical protein EWH70_17120 [Amycolatopsis suaedae]
MSVADVAGRLRQVLGACARARSAIQAAGDLASGARDLWANAVVGATGDIAREVDLTVGDCARLLDLVREVEDTLTRYSAALGVDIGRRPPSHLVTAPANTPLADRISTARRRVGKGRDGLAARGEWVCSDGSAIRVNSGHGDPHAAAAARFVRDQMPVTERAARRLATHVEIKIAVLMRAANLTDEVVVIDRQVCGTRDYDREDPVTCHRYLPRFLPPGARLRVAEPDGTIRTYRGEGTAS